MKHYFKFNASSTQIRTAKLMGKERKGISFPLLPGIITPPFTTPSTAMFSTLLPKLFGYFIAILTDKHVPLKIWSALRPPCLCRSLPTVPNC
jgi:hypothetical protein